MACRLTPEVEKILSNEQKEALKLFNVSIGYISNVLLGLSVLCSLFTIITFSLFPRIRTYPIKLILFLCITIVVGYGLFPFNNRFNVWPEVCNIVGAIIHYFFLSNFFWCGNIAFNFYEMIVRRNPETAAFEKFYHFFGWGLPCLAVVGVSIAGHYGSSVVGYGNCYIKESISVFLGFFLPGIILVSINAVLFFFVASEIHGTLRHAPNDKESKHKAKEFRVLMSIFVTVGLSWIFGFVTSIFTNVFIVCHIFLVIFTISAPLQGFFIFVAYCLNKKVKNRWMHFFGCHVDDGPNPNSTKGTQSTRGGAYSSSTTNSRSMNSRQY
jgi:hypothetical protein